MPADISLDFDTIKADLISYFQKQDEFSDYDFEGSALTVLIDALAYATHYNAMIANLSHSEAYLDSATIRRNVVSKAKELGYIPASTRSSLAIINISATNADLDDPYGGAGEFIVPSGTLFVASVDNATYTFQTIDDHALVYDAGIWSGDITVVEGVFRIFNWNYDATMLTYEFPSEYVDSNYVTISSKRNETADLEVWSSVRDVLTVNADSKVYWLQESFNGKIEFYFGDNRLGEQPYPGSTLLTKYLVSSGGDANNIKVFALASSINNINKSVFTLTLKDQSYGGANKESIESIRHSAPKSYAAQNRAITITDYATILKNEFSYVDEVNVWGGEDNDPPQYGRVFVSVKPIASDYLTLTQKNDIKNILSNKFSIIGITTEIIDPSYTYMNVVSDVTYDTNRTQLSPNELVGAVKSDLTIHIGTTESRYNTIIRYSNVLNIIDEADKSILGNVTSFTITKKDYIAADQLTSTIMDFRMALNINSITSIQWNSSIAGKYHWLADNGTGKIMLHNTINNTVEEIGTVNYTTGKIVIAFVPDIDVATHLLEVTATPTNTDIDINGNNLIKVGKLNISTTAYQV